MSAKKMISGKKPKIGFFNKIMLVFNIVAVCALLISYLASFVNPATFWPIAFFGLAYPAFLLVNVLFVVYWLIRLPKLSLISVIAILMGWNFVTAHLGFRETTAIEVPKSSESFIRIMTYNVHNFKEFGDNKNDKFTKDGILNIIRKEQPDIICFQEFFSRKKGEYNFEKLIAEVLNTGYYYYEPQVDNDYESFGMAIFSKFPIRNEGRIGFNDSGNEVLFADIERGTSRFRVYNVHFQSIRFKPEDYTYLNQVTKKIDTDVQSSRRIGSRLKLAFIKRGEQVKLVKQHAKKCTTPFIIAGDFNDTPISYTVNTMAKGMKNSFQKKGSGFGITYNGAFPNFQIDYILATPDFEVKNYRIVTKKLSDHYAVRSDLELK